MKYVGIGASYAGLIVALFLGASGQTLAASKQQQSATDAGAKGGGIKEIVVTAERRSSLIQSTPIAVTALSSVALRNQNVSDIRDIQSLVPDVSISANTGLEVPIAIRGISSTVGGIGADSPTAVYLDGVYIARPYAAIFDFVNIERIEVLRGPQGTLYGRNSTSGAINIITRPPTGVLSLNAAVEVGNYNDLQARGTISGPVAGDKLRASLSGSYRHRDGFYQNVTTGQHGVNPDDSATVAGALLYGAGDPFTFTLRADYSTSQLPAVTRELGGVYGTPLFSKATANFVYANNPGSSRVKSGGVSGTATFDLGSVALKSITAWRFLHVFTTNDVDASAVASQRIRLGPERQHQLSQELQLSSKDWKHGSFVLGVFAFTEKAENDFTFELFNGASISPTQLLDFYLRNKSQIEDTNLAAYGQVDYKLLPRLTVTLGGRYGWEKKKFAFGENTGVAPPQNPVPPVITILPPVAGYTIFRSSEWTSFTPKFGLSYQATPDMFLYGTVQKGFKSGGFSFADGAAPGFGPEKVWAYEVGIKTRWLDRRLVFNLTGFYYDYTNLQVSLTGAPGQRFTANAANSTIKGLEAETTIVPVDGLRITAFGTLLDAKYKDYRQDLTLQNEGGVPLSVSCPGGRLVGTTICDLSGNSLPRAPKWGYTIAAEYTFQLGEVAVTPRVMWHQEAETFYSEQNVAPLKNDGIQDLSARLTLNLSDGISIAGFVDNITNYRYIAGAIPVPPTVAGFTNWPRTYSIETRFRFE